MKTFKLLATGLVLACFCFTSHLNAQVKYGKSGKSIEEDFSFFCSCANDGAGEMITGTLVFKYNENNKFEIMTVKGKSIVGEDTGNVYNFTRVEKYNPETKMLVMNTRNIQKSNGLVTYWQIIGEVTGDHLDYWPLDLSDMTFYCREN